MKEDLVELGFCRAAHGLKGGFTFKLFNREDSVLKTGSKITLKGLENSNINSTGSEYEIDKISFGNKVIVYLKGISDRNSVDNMMPFGIYFPRENFPEDDAIYLVDLVGLKVYEHETDKEVGVLHALSDNGIQDILVIKKLSGEKLELPFVDNFFPVVDIENERIEVILPIEVK